MSLQKEGFYTIVKFSGVMGFRLESEISIKIHLDRLDRYILGIGYDWKECFVL